MISAVSQPKYRPLARAATTKPPEAGPTESFQAGAPDPGLMPRPSFDTREFRNAMGRFATGVAVITVGDDQQRGGMTVNSLTSLSLDPPLLLFCPKNESATLDLVKEHGTFAVNLLSADQADLCGQFAGKVEGDKFNGVAAHAGPVTGTPLLDGSLASVECQLEAIHPGGDHAIVVGRVVGFETSQPQEPLLFWNGKVQQSHWT